ncbi:MAG: HEAT repeat domain-containing protein [Myxococcales bacterium]|nr:HEAT repeat domain-containing protein [Myxococcales bacterium]
MRRAMTNLELDPSEMKPRRVSPIAIVVGLGIVALGAGAILMGLKTSGQKMSVEQRVDEQKNTFVLPEKDQLPRWRGWAGATGGDDELREESLRQLALLGDSEGISLATLALATPSHKVRGTAAQALAHYGKPAATAIPALSKALENADAADKPQITWSLVALGDTKIFGAALDLYRSGELTNVERLEGGRAFDPMKLARLVSVDELATRADDPSAAVRQLVAIILSEKPDKKHTDVLIKLVADTDVAVAREAASGLGRIADEKARGPLVAALSKADQDSRQKFLEALRDGIGGVGLVLALDTVVPEPEQRNWFQHKQLFELIHLLADPRAGDALVSWLERAKPSEHWKAEAGIALAEIGDARGAKYLGPRMIIAPEKLYNSSKFWESNKGGHLSRGDEQRTVAARMLADLAVLAPDKSAELRGYAEAAVMQWSTDRPQPHANGLRFLAAVKSKAVLEPLRKWAFPTDKLPPEGGQPPMPSAWETAHSALRYIGWMRDEPSKSKLLDQFGRKKDGKMDITQAGLEGAGLAMLGMVLRGVTVGASQGLSQWGPDAGKEVPAKLMEFIEDRLWHEEAREEACAALGFVADNDTMKKVAEKVGKFAANKEPKDQFIGACYAVTLTRNPASAAVPMMVELLDPKLDVVVRTVIGWAIGAAGLKDHPAAAEKLFKMLDDNELRNAAALALILGGNTDQAARAVASYARPDSQMALESLKDSYFRAFGYWSDRDLDRGNLYRWVENAEALHRVKLGGAPQEWARQLLRRQFDNLDFDNGPHSETRVVLRHRLYLAAKSGPPEARRSAMRTLKFMGAQGTLMALKDEPGETGELAEKAFHQLLNPATSAGDQIKSIAGANKDEASK